MQLNNATRPESNQDMFDRSWERLVTKFSMGQSFKECPSGGAFRTAGFLGYCIYHRRENNVVVNACVLGWVLPEHFTKDNDCGTLRQLFCESQEVVRWFDNVARALLVRLQEAHDTHENWSDETRMRTALTKIAETFRLKIPETKST